MSMKKIPSDLLIVLLWTIFTFIFTAVPALNNTVLKSILGTVAILFIPGYMLIAALFPKRTLGNVERIALSLGSNIVVVPLLGLILNFTFGIGPVPVLIALCLYTIIMILIVIYQRGKLSDDERFSVNIQSVYEIVNNGLFRPKDRKDTILTVILVFSIISAMGMMYFAITTPKIGEKFTEFYVLNSSEKAQYPANLKLDTPATFIIGVTNHEYADVDYIVQTVFDKDIMGSENVTLKHNDSWKKDITFTPNKEGSDSKIEFLLFKENDTGSTENNIENMGNDTEPYRKLYLYVNVVK